MGNGVMVLQAEPLERAIAPDTLADTLESLRQAGVIAGFSFSPARILIQGGRITKHIRQGESVCIDGDAKSLEMAAASLSPEVPEPAPGQMRVSDYRAEYYRRMEHFQCSPQFDRLPILNRNILNLHAQGLSNQQIAMRLTTTIKRIRLAINAARVMASLPKTSSVMPRGG